jgi:dipeptidyl aminopeptidase/acylaminoacyl peptidase
MRFFKLVIAINCLFVSPMVATRSGQNVFAQTTHRPESILIAKSAYSFPTFQTALESTSIKLYATKKEYDDAISDKAFEFSKLTYWSDGLRVKAYLYAPKSRSAKLPVIVFNRGGAVRGDIAPELISMFHQLAKDGFAVIAPMYRQSDGGEGRDEMGGAEVNDLMNVAGLLSSFDFLDVNNVFLYGESRGSVMTYLAIRKRFPANAAAVFGSITDLEEFLKENTQTFPQSVLNAIWPGYDEKKADILESRSAFRWAEQINIPILLMHGGSDSIVDPRQSLAMAEKLLTLQKPYQLVIFEGDNHYLTVHHQDRDREALAWFKKYIKR